jgi:hypothetical protein
MHIIWNPNPLATVVELDEYDRQILRLKIEIDLLRNRMYRAHFDLDPTMRAQRNEPPGKRRTLDEAVTAAIASLDVAFTDGEGERRGKTWEQLLDAELADHIRELAGIHFGDCTCEPCSCLKCRAESLIGVNTLAGLGKHEGSHVADAFTARLDAIVPTLDEAIDSLTNYRPTKGPCWDRHTDAEFQRHVPRWTQEAASAAAWLVAYKAEHFAK